VNIEIRRACATLLALCVSVGVHGFEEDRLQEIIIKGESAELDEQSGVITYKGAVTLKQGSLALSADVLRAVREDGQVVEITASQGEAADAVSYAQCIRPDEPEVTAVAQEMIYDLRAQTIQLRGDAVLQQSDVEFRGTLILYDIARGKTEASGEVEMRLPASVVNTLGTGQEDQGSVPQLRAPCRR